jgi:hypothetical protein
MADRESLKGMRQRARLLWAVIPSAAVLASPAHAAERELDEGPAPNSAREIRTPIERMITRPPEERPPLLPRLSRRLQKLPPFFADARLEARFRTYYLRNDRTDGVLSEAWAMGGSIDYRSGWVADLFAVRLQAFTSQPIVAPKDRDGTLLLAPEQEGYSVLGIANGNLRYRGIFLTGGRLYLDLPYINRDDNRMTPNTFEAIRLEKPEGEFRFVTGYAWNFKERNSDEFVSFAEAAGVNKERGLAYGGVLWDPNENFHLGLYTGAVPDLSGRVYGELGGGRDLRDGWEARFDGQFSYKFEVGDELLGDAADDNWNLGIRASVSKSGAVFRLGLGIAESSTQDLDDYGGSALYVDLMQRTFNRPDEKALLASVSYDFSGIGVDGLSAIVNFAAGFDGKADGRRSDAQEVDVTIDYRLKHGRLESFWLRVRGSWLNDELAEKDGTEIRVVLRYDVPVI